MDAAPGTCLTEFESRSVSQILVAGMDDSEKFRLKPCVAVIVLKGLDEKEAFTAYISSSLRSMSADRNICPFGYSDASPLGTDLYQDSCLTF